LWQTQIPANFEIPTQDLIYYLIFAFVIIFFQVLVDVFSVNILEQLMGWSLFQYLEHAQYRFAVSGSTGAHA